MPFKQAQLKKVLTSLVVCNLIFGPVSTAFSLSVPTGWEEVADSQTLLWSTGGNDEGWNVINETSTRLPDSNTLNFFSSGNTDVYGPNSPISDLDNILRTDNDSNLVETQSGATSDREQKDSQSDQQAAKALEEQQKKDQEECNKQGMGAGSSALGQALGPSLENSASQALSESAKEAIPQTIKDGVTKVVPTIVKDSLTTQLPPAIKNEFPPVLQSRLAQEAAKGTNLSDSATMNKIIESELTNFLNQKIPTIINQAISTKLPGELSDYMSNNLSGNITNLMGNNLQTTLQRNIPTALTNNLSDQIDSSLRYNLASSATNLPERDILNLDQRILSSINNQVLSGFNSQMGDITSQINQQIGESIAPMVSSLSSQLTGQLGQELSSQIANSVSSNLGTALAGEISAHVLTTLDTSINNSLGQITGQLNTSINQIMGSITNPIDASINEVMNSVNQSVNQITGAIMNPINQSMNQVLGSLDSSIQQITGTFTGALTGTLSDITGAITGPLTETLSSITGAITDPITGALTGLTNSITAPFTDALSGLTSNITAPFTSALSGITSSITAPLTGALGGVSQSIFSGAGNLTGGIIGGGDWSSGAIVTSQQIAGGGGGLAGATQGTLQGITGGGMMASMGLSIIAGAYVPVKEQDGPLLKATKNIDTTTADIKKLTVEICKHTKSLQRIQQKFEQKEFSEDPSARAQARTGLGNYAIATKDYIDTGYTVDASGAAGALYVPNLPQHLAQQAKEASQVATEIIKNSGNNDADDINRAIAKDKDKTGAEMLKSTISKETRNKLINDPGSMSASEGWAAFLETSEPQNNFRGSYILALDLIGQKQAMAVGAARDEFQAFDGFLPTRECVAKTSDGSACVEWKNTTPGSINKTVADNIMTIRQDLYTQAKNKDEVAKGNEPQVKEVANFQPVAGSGGWTGAGANGGSGGGSSNLVSSLLNMLQSGGGGNITDLLSQLTNQNSQTATAKPVVSISLARTSLKKASVKWSATGGATCKAGNDWYSRGTDTETQIVKAVGESLGSSEGSIAISIPVSGLPVKLTIRQNAFIYDIGTTVRTSGNGLVKETTFSLASDSAYRPQVGDIYTLKVGDQSVSFTNNTNGLAEGIEGLEGTVGELDPASEAGKKFSQVKFIFNSKTGKITSATILKYKISCTNSVGTTVAETTN